jgi:two-component system, chemotaxis family, sensor kinase CheA
MSDGLDDLDLRELFGREAGTLLERLASGALELEERPDDPELVASLFRAAHTLKGSAALVGITEVRDVTHALEDVLGALREGRLAAGPEVADVLLSTVDDLRVATPRLVAGEDVGDVGLAAAARLRAVLAGERPTAPAPQGSAPSSASAPAAAPPVSTPQGSDPSPSQPPPAAPRAAATSAPAPQGSDPSSASPPPAAPRAAATSAPAPEGSDPSSSRAAGSRAAAAGDETLPVPLSRLDRLVRLAGESRTQRLRLVEALGPLVLADPEVEAALAALDRTLADLQRTMLASRMVTLGAIAEPLRRAVRDVARTTGKQVDYVLEGERAEIDRAVLDVLREPLLHLVRNAVDHGLEAPAARRSAGKPETGQVRVAARRRGQDLEVRVSDDGRGLDPDRLRARAPNGAALSDAEALATIFEPGFSTAEEVTEVSGRGVGLDAVRSAVERLRGTVRAEGVPGAGSTFTITVPVTLAVLRCVLVAVGSERYAVPSHAVASIADEDEARVALEGGAAVWVGSEIVPVADLGAAVGAGAARDDGPALVLRREGRKVAVRVDALLGQRDLTVQELGAAVPRTPLVAGGAIDADGSVLLVLDPVALADRAAGVRRAAPVLAAVGAEAVPHGPGAGARARVLVVDDALTVRELQRSILERHGFEVETAEDGEAALALLDRRAPDLVLTDVEMPRLDGFGLVEAIRARADLAGLPVLIVSSRSDEADRRRGLEAGADGYLVKQAFDEATLLAAVERMLG